MAGGLSLGGAESVAPLVILEPLGVDGVSQLKDAVAFLVLIFVLLIVMVVVVIIGLLATLILPTF